MDMPITVQNPCSAAVTVIGSAEKPCHLVEEPHSSTRTSLSGVRCGAIKPRAGVTSTLSQLGRVIAIFNIRPSIGSLTEALSGIVDASDLSS